MIFSIQERRYQTFVKIDEIISYIIKKIENEDYLDTKKLDLYFDLAKDFEVKQKNNLSREDQLLTYFTFSNKDFE